MPGAFHFKHNDGRPIKWRVLAPCALTITTGCLGVTHWVLGHIPRANVPLALEYVMMLGWVTGLYLTLSATTVRYLIEARASDSFKACFDLAHALQLPIVLVGVGVWAVVKALGWL